MNTAIITELLYSEQGDITLSDAFYEFINLVKTGMDAKIKSGENIKRIYLRANLHYSTGKIHTPKINFEFDIE